jgi:glycosyltransferase involved in cell wall biosynthesis
MTTEFPRLLVATEFPPNGAGGGPAVLRQMLKDWPVEKLFWWNYYPETNELFGRKVAEHRIAFNPQKLYPSRRWRALKSWLMANFWVPSVTRHFRQALADLKPDVVWVIPHCWSILPLAAVLPDAGTGFHVSVHDYPDLEMPIARFGARRCAQMAAMVDQLYARATTRDAICQAMADDLRARTKCDGFIAHAALEREDFEYLSRIPETQSGPIRIAYAGTIIAEKEFALFARALAQIRSRRPLTLEFYGNHSYRSENWFDSSWMHEHGNLPVRELLQALKECTWGFAPMQLTDDDPRYNRFSLPAKVASYLAAGLPIIALGHPQSTVVKLASQYQIGLCLTDGNLENLCGQLLAALSEPNPQIKYRPALQRCARAKFDAQRMRAVLYENFQTCASATRARNHQAVTS